MAKKSIRYNPSLSIKENAIKNGCSEDAIRYYIKSHAIDRRAEQAARMVTKLRACYEEGKPLSHIAKEAGCSLNTLKRYWSFVISEDEPSKSGNKKCQKLTVKQKNEYYATHPSVTQDLLSCEQFTSPILEPCCGGGFMAEVIKNRGYEVYATDIIDRGYGTGNIDFLTADFPIGEYDIITNPPYTLFVPMLEKAMEICNSKVAMLLPLNFLSSKERYEVFKKYPPKSVYVYVERICIAKGGKFEEYESSSNMQIYAWYVWEKGFEGETTLRWISNKKSLHKAVKALILDFDHTLFNTNADREVRKNSKVKDWDLIFSKISEYKLYDGWREVFNTAKTKGVKIAIISTAKKELIQRTLKHFQLDCDVIIGWQRCYQKPNPKLVEMALKKLQVSKEEVVSIGDSVLDKQMSINCEVRFIGAIWDCEKEESFAELQRGITISSPFEIIDIL